MEEEFLLGVDVVSCASLVSQSYQENISAGYVSLRAKDLSTYLILVYNQVDVYYDFERFQDVYKGDFQNNHESSMLNWTFLFASIVRVVLAWVDFLN